MFRETISGERQDRAQLLKLLDRLEPEDVLLVTRLDRLARSTRDLLNILGTVAEKDAAFRSQTAGRIRRHPMADSCGRCWEAWPSSSAN